MRHIVIENPQDASVKAHPADFLRNVENEKKRTIDHW